MSESVLIVGAGIIGLNCAYHLERAGYAVTLIDQAKVADACSHANCGYVCPSHVLPLTVPGSVKMAMKSLFTPNAPFKVKPSLDPALLKWMLQFAKRCNHASMIETGHALKVILDASMETYRAMLAEERLDCEWRDDGLMYAFATEAGFEGFAEEDALLQKHFGVAAQAFDGAELHARDPALKPDLAGGFWYPGDATVRPDKLNDALHALLVARGVTSIEDCTLTGLKKAGGKVEALETSQGELSADHVVLATGAWSAKWASAFECALPVQPGKGYSVTMERPELAPRASILFPETRVGITPMEGRIRFGSMMEFSGYDTTIKPERLALLHEGANPYLVEPINTPVLETWYGWRPMTYDSLPIIGPAPRLKNVLFATGHNMIGLSLGAATGKLVAELLAGDTPHIDPAPYAASRF